MKTIVLLIFSVIYSSCSKNFLSGPGENISLQSTPSDDWNKCIKDAIQFSQTYCGTAFDNFQKNEISIFVKVKDTTKNDNEIEWNDNAALQRDYVHPVAKLAAITVYKKYENRLVHFDSLSMRFLVNVSLKNSSNRLLTFTYNKSDTIFNGILN